MSARSSSNPIGGAYAWYQTGLHQFLDEKSYKPVERPFTLKKEREGAR